MTSDALKSLLFTLCLTEFVLGQAWTSPDGFLTVTPPDATSFQATPNPPPPFLALWTSEDQSMLLGIMKMDIPADIRLIQSSAEEGLAEEIGGRVTRLPTKTISGYEVWNMTAKGPAGEISQAMVRHGGTLYKLMALSFDSDHDAPLFSAFVDSMSISQPIPADSMRAKTPEAQLLQDLGAGVDRHKISKSIGGAGALLAIGLLVYFLLRGKIGRRS
jgi:hypothetical protein